MSVQLYSCGKKPPWALHRGFGGSQNRLGRFEYVTPTDVRTPDRPSRNLAGISTALLQFHVSRIIRLLDRSKICKFHIGWFLIDAVWRGGTDPYNYEWNWFRLSLLQRYFCVGTTVRKTPMPGEHTCCLLQHNHGLNLRLRSSTDLSAATNKRREGEFVLWDG